MRRAVFVAAALAAVLAWAPAARSAPVPWCGSDEPTVDLPDDVNAFEWHVLYVLPSDRPDAFASYAPRIVGDLAAANAWWVTQDPTRRLRFDLRAAPGCATDPYGRLDISLVHLPRANGEYDFNSILAAVGAAGFDDSDKAYLVYYDGALHPGDSSDPCGQGNYEQRPLALAVVYLDSCSLSTHDDARAIVATHEMLHGLGAVSTSAPHACDDGHVCDSRDDIMKAFVSPADTLSRLVLDAGHDDYYAHSGAWFDSQDDPLLDKLDRPEASPVLSRLTATNVGSLIRVEWSAEPATADLRYRVYDAQRRLVRDNASTTLTADGSTGETYVWTIRAATPGGMLSAPQTIQFKVGYGIVDGAGTLVRDTVAPGKVHGLHASQSKSRDVVLTWQKVSDPLRIKGYRVSAPGLRTLVVTATTARLPVRGKTVTVAAVDEAGNVGPTTSLHVPR